MSTYTINIPVATIGQATTCLACGIRLPSLETQQLHHKSDWHTYNLKRKMVGLPPVPSEVFAQLVNASREQANPEDVPQPECVPCGKKYLSFQAYDNHLQSKKHKQIAAAYSKKQQEKEQIADSRPNEDDTTATTSTTTNASPKETTASEQREPSETVCLFCSHQSTDALSNYGHMRTAHGFFLPSSERLIDLEGMLAYLADKLVENLDCLWCTPSVFSTHLRPDQELNAGFANLASVRRHMLDKGHCKLAMEHGAEREYADFYLPLEDSFDSDNEDAEELDAEQHKESSQEDSSMDEDEQRLNMVLLDDEGNWILDDQASQNSGIRVDPVTNELVLNNRRLAHKDAVRRQKVETRTVTLASSRPNHRRPDSAEEGQENTGGGNSDKKEIMLTSDVHHPTIKLSNSLLKSQNQLSSSNLALNAEQRHEVAAKNASAQNFESNRRERMATQQAVKHNSSARRRYAATYGINN
ncbi:hypothetical protein BGX29_009455 [Mortierella sp. GBA35]|nr:hypothetical protein BGX29_009455 [Mortierella sp. GBA35]